VLGNIVADAGTEVVGRVVLPAALQILLHAPKTPNVGTRTDTIGSDLNTIDGLSNVLVQALLLNPVVDVTEMPVLDITLKLGIAKQGLRGHISPLGPVVVLKASTAELKTPKVAATTSAPDLVGRIPAIEGRLGTSQAVDQWPIRIVVALGDRGLLRPLHGLLHGRVGLGIGIGVEPRRAHRALLGCLGWICGLGSSRSVKRIGKPTIAPGLRCECFTSLERLLVLPARPAIAPRRLGHRFLLESFGVVV